MVADRPTSRASERGAALLTVLLLVAVIAVLAATALEKLRLSTRLAGNGAAIQQARAYGYAAETLAMSRVSEVLSRDPSRVTLAGGWSGKSIPLPVPNGQAAARIVDGGNCFNLNGLVRQIQPGLYASYTPAVAQFARLMRIVGVSAQLSEPIAAAASDWIDSDSTPIAFGAEDDAYARLRTPYRTANTLMADPSELRAVSGVTPQIYAKLRPWICALPIAGVSKINVNTLLPEQLPVFAMLLPDNFSPEAARQVLLKRPPQGYSSTVAFWNMPELASASAFTDAQAQTSVTTQWFALDVDVSIGNAELQQRALIDATRLPARLVSRQWGDSDDVAGANPA